ncbi:hydrolase [Planotetraspora thailandica]|uniref:Hydrolase n=1 Tax=Planotetraspora thailandica TaxID=487172 RepID=A0A8J3XTX8_9ACTN|nr:alpha/beta hydrolase [Planotetraspora thailandica]GII52565.1 hydrolase [Planotetraspora thailandica]
MFSFVSYDGTVLAYHEQGEGSPLVCLPGGPGRSSAYLGDLGGLATRRRLVLLDPRGTGESAPPADPATYAADRMVADVEALRAHLGLERIDLLGHSAAGALALLYAARHPDRIGHLVLVTPSMQPVGLELGDAEWYARIELRAGEDWYDSRLPDLKAWDAGDESRRLQAQAFFYSPWNETADAHATRFAGRSAEVAERFLAGLPPAEETRKALTKVAGPVLVIAGELDPEPVPAQAAEAAGLFPYGTSLTLPGAHYPWVTAPDAFADAVGSFLDGPAQTGV